MISGKGFQLAWRERRQRLLREAISANLTASRQIRRRRRHRAMDLYRILLGALLFFALLGICYEFVL